MRKSLIVNLILLSNLVFAQEAVEELSLNEEWVGTEIAVPRETRREERIDKFKKHLKNIHGSVTTTVLYLKAIEDSLRYAEIVPRNSTSRPVIRPVGQKFDWSYGFRVRYATPTEYDHFEVGAEWTYFYSNPPAVHKTSPDSSLVAAVTIPVFASNGNSLVDEVNANWTLSLNVFDIDLRDRLCIGKLALYPVGGLRIGVLNQRIGVHYGNYVIQFAADNSPKDVAGKNNFLGVGPKIGMNTNYRLPKGWGLYFNGAFSGLLGTFKLETRYTNLINTPDGSSITLKESSQRFTPEVDMQLGLYKYSKFSERGSMEVSVGWEGQFWFRQMRMTLFNSLIPPKGGSDLSFTGWSFKIKASF